MIFETVYPNEAMGEDADLSMSHAAAKGMHDAVSSIVQYVFIGGVIIMAGAIIFKPKQVGKLIKRFTS